MSSQVIAIVGASGSGKTWLGERLSARLVCPRLAIDDFGKEGSDRWPLLISAIKGIDGRVVVESCATPLAYRQLIGFSVLLRIPNEVRSRQLRQRGESLRDAERLVCDTSRTGTVGDLVLDRVDASTPAQVERALLLRFKPRTAT